MKTVNVTTLKARLSEHLRYVKRGQSVSITERGDVIATIVPHRRPGVPETDDERVARLIREGRMRPPRRPPLPKGFFDNPPVPASFGLLEALLEERREGR